MIKNQKSPHRLFQFNHLNHNRLNRRSRQSRTKSNSQFRRLKPRNSPLARLILIRASQTRFFLCWWCHAQQIHIRLMTNFKRARVCKLKVYETFVRDCTKLVVVVACQWDTNTAEFEWNHNTTKAPNHRKTIPVWDWQVDRSLKIKLCDFSAVFLSPPRNNNKQTTCSY